MAIKEVVKVSGKTFFNPRAWLGYDALKDQTKLLLGIAKPIFVPPKPESVRKETFEEAKNRLKVTDTDLQEISKNYFFYALFFAVLGLGVLGFAFFLVLGGHIFDFIIGLCVSTILFSQAFKFHFWHFQIKHKKLGCTFNEWLDGKPKNEG